MANNRYPVSFWCGTKAEYAVLTKSANTLYFVTDENALYKGSVPFAKDIEKLLSVSATAPQSATAGDKYYNSSSKKIFICTATGSPATWDSGTTPSSNIVYFDIAAGGLYRWSGSAMETIGGGSDPTLSNRVTVLESGATTLSGAVFVSGGTVTSAAMLSGSVETLSGYAYVTSGGSTTSAHFYDSLAVDPIGEEGGFVAGDNITVRSGAVVNNISTSFPVYISGGYVKRINTNDANTGNITQYAGSVGSVYCDNIYTMSGGSADLLSCYQLFVYSGVIGSVCITDNCTLYSATVLSNVTFTGLDDGTLTVLSGAVLRDAIISGGIVTVSSGAVLSNITLNGGTLSVMQGGAAYGVHYISGAWTSNGVTVSGYDDPILGRRRTNDLDLPVVSGGTVTSAVINTVQGGTRYEYGVLTSLTISNVASSHREAIITFSAGTAATSLDVPGTLQWLNGELPEIGSNCSVCISFQDNMAVCGKFAEVEE